MSWFLRADAQMTRLPPRLKFSFAVAVSLVVGWSPQLETLMLALRRDEYSHILLVVPTGAAPIYMEWFSLQADSKANNHIGPALLIAAVLFALGGKFTARSDTQLMWRMLALVTWWLGAFIGCFGVRTFRSLLFPLCFLFWLVPIPELRLNEIVDFWQHGSAISAGLPFSAAGRPVIQNGIVLSIPGLTLEVAQECSSLCSRLMLVVTSMLLAHLFLGSIWRKTAVILVALPLSIAKNGVRIFTISLLGTHVDPGFLHGDFHHHGGIVFFLLALFTALLMIWVLNRGEHQSSWKSSPGQRPTHAAKGPMNMKSRRLTRNSYTTCCAADRKWEGRWWSRGPTSPPRPENGGEPFGRFCRIRNCSVFQESNSL